MPVRKRYNCSLLEHNTMSIDAKAKEFISYDTVEELIAILCEIRDKGQRILHIGRGSNLLFTQDFDGAVLHSGIKFIEYVSRSNQEIIVRAGAGVVWDDFCAQMAQKNYYGCENLSYIPGEVGASAVQNIGAYGVEVESIIQEVETIEIATGTRRVFKVEECEYGYRDSIFKNRLQGQYIVTAVVYRLSTAAVVNLEYGQLKELRSQDSVPSAQEIREAVIAIRKSKLPEPSELGNAGSFFKNPVVPVEVFNELAAVYSELPHYVLNDKQVKIPAAWLIDKCGWKGKCHGGAAVYEKQPLIIVNRNKATAADIMELATLIQQSVYDKFRINIYPEVNYI